MRLLAMHWECFFNNGKGFASMAFIQCLKRRHVKVLKWSRRCRNMTNPQCEWLKPKQKKPNAPKLKQNINIRHLFSEFFLVCSVVLCTFKHFRDKHVRLRQCFHRFCLPYLTYLTITFEYQLEFMKLVRKGKNRISHCL